MSISDLLHRHRQLDLEIDLWVIFPVCPAPRSVGSFAGDTKKLTTKFAKVSQTSSSSNLIFYNNKLFYSHDPGMSGYYFVY